ncbi:hypothetical protein IV102_25035 [bacterium]|nr:hypothetical protein [bacterium]
MVGEKSSFEVGRCLRDTWDLYCRHFIFVLSLSLICIPPVGAIVTWLDRKEGPFGGLVGLLLIPWLAALLWGVQQRENGQQFGIWRSLWQGLKLSPRLLGVRFLSGICILSSTLMLILPGIYACVVLSLSSALALTQDRAADRSINESYDLTREHFWKLLGFWLALGGLLLLALLGHCGLTGALLFSGLADHAAVSGPLPRLVYLVGSYQGVALFHLAGLAALQQLTREQQPVGEISPGLTPERLDAEV